MWQFALGLLTISISALLWWLGGNGFKAARTFFLPIVIALAKFAMIFPNFLTLLYAPALMALLAIFSYGLGAPLHILWVFIFGGKGADGSYPPVEFCTRASCGFLWSLAGIPFALATGHWIGQIVYSVVAAIGCGIFGLVKIDSISEGGTGATVATSVFI